MKTKNNAQPTEKAQAVFLLEGVGVFLKTPDLEQMILQNDFGAISVTRNTPKKGTAHAIGFAIEPEEDTDEEEDEEEEFDEDEYNAFIKKVFRWFE